LVCCIKKTLATLEESPFSSETLFVKRILAYDPIQGLPDFSWNSKPKRETKWPQYVPNARMFYKHLLFRGPPKDTQIVIFGVQIYVPSGIPALYLGGIRSHDPYLAPIFSMAGGGNNTMYLDHAARAMLFGWMWEKVFLGKLNSNNILHANERLIKCSYLPKNSLGLLTLLALALGK
jgi:hypothetical protein